MTTTILCFVCLALLMWVIYLKLEIATLMADHAKQHPGINTHAVGNAKPDVKGMRKFEL